MKSGITEILCELISIDSNCARSNEQIIDYIQNQLNKFECTKYKIANSDLGLYNLVVKIKGAQSNSPIVFVGHTDTVPAAKDWITNPLLPVEKEGKIYGLGASDMKSGLAAMIYAAITLDKIPPQDVYLIFDADEEGEMRGSQDLIGQFSLNNVRVIVAEPTSGKITTGQKGCLDLEIEVPGKAIHSSKADFEWNIRNNANYLALSVLNALSDYESRLSSIKDTIYGSPTNNIGVIRGGTAPNATSDSCVIKISRRLIPSENISTVYQDLCKIIQNTEPNATIRKLFWGETFQTSEDTNFIRLVKQYAGKFIGNVECNFKTGWTEAALFAKWGEAVIFGPGDDLLCHQANEYVEVGDMERFVDIYKELIKSPVS